jgi:uncharacterized glyoxalase superfamily protein PhnB
LFAHAAAVLPVDNVVTTAEFYRDKFGFDLVYMRGDPPYYAIMRRAGVGIHFSEREDTRTKIQPISVYIYVSDVDAVYEKCQSKGLEMFLPPEDQEYGMREFEVSDLNGHFLVFGQEL